MLSKDPRGKWCHSLCGVSSYGFIAHTKLSQHVHNYGAQHFNLKNILPTDPHLLITFCIATIPNGIH